MPDTCQRYNAKNYVPFSTVPNQVQLCLWQGKFQKEASESDASWEAAYWVESCVQHPAAVWYKRASFIDESVEGTEAFQFPNPI